MQKNDKLFTTRNFDNILWKKYRFFKQSNNLIFVLCEKEIHTHAKNIALFE